jgi:hypothetical protein
MSTAFFSFCEGKHDEKKIRQLLVGKEKASHERVRDSGGDATAVWSFSLAIRKTSR